MELSISAIKTILDIKEDIVISEKEMAKNLKVTFYPKIETNDGIVLDFAEKLKKTMIELGVNVVPYEETLESISLSKKLKMFLMMIKINIKNFLSGKFEIFKFDFGKKIKKGIVVVSTGEGIEGDLSVDHILGLKGNPMVLITKQPQNIQKNSSFKDHLESSLPVFSWNIVNLVLSVGKEYWTIYSFNMSYPMYLKDDDLSKNILHGLIPKMYAPVIPPRMKDFEIKNNVFDVYMSEYAPYVKDLVESGKALEKTGLYPEPKKINELPFRNSFYRWLGSLLLDKRSGMSYGFIARQLPIKISELFEDNSDSKDKKDFFFKDGKLFIRILFKGKKYVLKVPDVWVLTSRSGSDKTNLNPSKDLVKMGLVCGKMIMETPKGVSVGPNYKPSFDTKVIFAHSVANAIFASIIKHFNPSSKIPKMFEKNGRALAHWHGYFNQKLIPKDWYYYGRDNSSVSCSAPQGAIYAFEGKEKMFMDVLEFEKGYVADIHIEPQHGSNISFSSLGKLSEFILKNKKITSLGNEYLK